MIRRTLATRFAVGVPAVVVLVCGALVWASTRRAEAGARAVEHAREVMIALERTLSSLKDAETGQRGYLLTGDSAYLAPYHTAVSAVWRDLDSVGVLTRGTLQRAARVRALRDVTRAKLAELDTTITVRSRAGAAPALAIVRTGRGKALMDSARVLVAAVESREEAVLVERQDEEARFRRRVEALLVAGVLVSALAVSLSGVLFARDAAAQARLAREVEERNRRLEEQAAEMQEQAAEMEIQLQQNQELTDTLESAGDELRAERDRAETLAAEAQAANRAKSEFLAAMSHELRTPLNAIAGYGDLLDAGVYGALNEGQAGAVARIRAAEGVLLGLISDVLDFAQAEAGRLEVRSEDFPVEPLLEEVGALLAPTLQAQGLAYRHDPAATGLAAQGDPVRVRQVLVNLVGNAAKFTEPGGTVSVSAAAHGGRVRISVSDTGRGIPARHLDAVFERFVQLERGRAERSQQGLGLGLSISRDLARRMGGDLTVESEEGVGSTFTLELPAASA